MKKKKRSAGRLALLFLCAVVALSAVLTSLYLLRSSADYFDNEAEMLAIEYTKGTAASISTKVASSFDFVDEIAAKAAGVSGFEAMDAFGAEQVRQYGLTCLQFLKDDGVEYRYGESVGNFSAAEVQRIIHSSETVCSNVFADPSLGSFCVAIYSPVLGSEEVDGVLIYKPTARVFGGMENVSEDALFYALADEDGLMLESRISEDFAPDVSHNAFTYLYNVCENKPQADDVAAAAKGRLPEACPLSIGGGEYVAAVMPVTTIGSGCTVVCVYDRQTLLHGEYGLYDKFMGTIAVLALITCAAIAGAFISARVSERRVTIIDEFDPLLGCNTLNRFTQEAELILERNRLSKFAVCYMMIKNFMTMGQRFGEEITDEALHHIANVLKKATTENESFGHITEDRFVFMIHYTDLASLDDKLKVMTALFAYDDKLRALNYTLSASLGVFLTKETDMPEVLREEQTGVADAVNRAKIACMAHAKAYEKPFVIYSPSLGSAFVEDAKVEGRMQDALDNNEFRLFFQPKCNITQKNLDSAEVLVRWYDEETKKYQAPAAFIRIFETNGFIIKLDHYVFRETCIFLKEMKQTGQKTVPLSVNVSRVTAIEPGFVEFYRKVKEEFGIPNGYITLEFTETFAYDSYTTLARLTRGLQQAGFLCSIDDFGVGYSAIHILKELPVDEIKVDKELLTASGDPKRDQVILECVYRMAKELGLKLIQEGVETKEELDYIYHLGCNIVQGYYYSKPLHTTDFIDFINDSRLSKLLRA